MITTFKEVYHYRSLVSALVGRHLSTRYRGSALGFLWSLLNPLFMMGVYTLVFHYYVRFSAVENYTLFLFSGLLPWIWISSALIEGTCAISSGGHLITKSLFPAHVLPLVAVLTSLVNFLFSVPLLVVFMVAAGVRPHLSMMLLPILVLLQLFFLYGATLLLSSLNVFYRDVQHLVGNILSLIFFLCPIIYSVATIPERFRFTIDLNPFALFIVTYQELLLNGTFPSLVHWGILLCWSFFMVVIGDFIYQRYRESFAELL